MNEYDEWAKTHRTLPQAMEIDVTLTRIEILTEEWRQMDVRDIANKKDQDILQKIIDEANSLKKYLE